MKCVQCNRERKLSVARTPKFCTQRCIMQWLLEHPDKTPKDAVGDSNAPLFSLPALTNQPAPTTKDGAVAKKPLSRALKKLNIDMAAPGTTLPLPADKNDTPSKVPKTVRIPTSDANISKKPRFSQPASLSAKRSVVTPQPSAIKKAKQIEKTHVESLNNSKSVKFDLSSSSTVVSPIASILTPPAVSYAPLQATPTPRSISIVPLDRLSEFVSEQQKKFQESATPKKEISIPKGTAYIVLLNWSISCGDCDENCTHIHTVHYSRPFTVYTHTRTHTHTQTYQKTSKSGLLNMS